MNLDKLTLEYLHGNQRELAEAIGMEAYKRLVLKYGGGNIYICKLDTLLQPIRDNEIYHYFTGNNYRELAITYNLTEKTVRDIIDRQNAMNMSGQMSFLQEEF